MKTRDQQREDKKDSPLRFRISSDPTIFRRSLVRTKAVKHGLNELMRGYQSDDEREDMLTDRKGLKK